MKRIMFPALALLSGAAQAQTGDVPVPATLTAEEEQQEQQERQTRQGAKAATQSPTAEVGTGLAGTGINFVADGDSKSVSIVGTRSWDSGGGDTLATNALSLKVSTEVTNKDDSAGSFITDLGLTSGTAGEFSYTRVWTSNPPLPSTAEERDRLKARAVAKCLEKARTKPAKSFCTDELTTLGDLLEHLDPAERLALTDPWVRNPVHLFGLTVGMANKEFEFRDPTTLAEDDTTKRSWVAAAQYGQSRLFGTLGRAYLGIAASYKSEYKLPDPRILCATPPPTGPQECFQAAFAPPSRKESITVSVIGRKQGVIGLLDLPFALQVKPAYEFRREVFGVETSLYVFPAKVGMRGGVRLKLQSDDNDPDTTDDNATIGLFVGTAF